MNEDEIKEKLAAAEEREKELRARYGDIQRELIALKALQKEAKKLEAEFEKLYAERRALHVEMLHIAAEGTGFIVKG